jgi:TRAP-type mannitol/chloroaromatic compound transport system permease large subunit
LRVERSFRCDAVFDQPSGHAEAGIRAEDGRRVVAISGTLAMLLPTSVALVLYGILADVSISKLLISGILPALLITLTIMLTIYILVWLEPARAPIVPAVPLDVRLRMLRVVGPMLFLFSGMTGRDLHRHRHAHGSVCRRCVRGIPHRSDAWFAEPTKLRSGFLARGASRCMISMVLLGAHIFGYYFTLAQVPQNLVAWVGGLAVFTLGDHRNIAVRLYRARFLHGSNRDFGPDRPDRGAAGGVAWLRSDLVRRGQDRDR